MTVSLAKQSPDEWLLEVFDESNGRPPRHGDPGRVGYIRQMFQLVDDHPDEVCVDSVSTGLCRAFSGYASWPVPNAWSEL